MPRVPTFGRREVAPQGLPNARVTEQRANVGGAISQGVGQALGAFQKLAQDERDKADNAAVIEADTALDTYETETLFNPEKGAFTRKGKDAFDLPNQVLPGFDTETQRIEQGLGSDRAKQVFRQRVGQRRGFINRQLNQYEAREREGFYDSQDDASIKSSQAIAGNFFNNRERIDAELAKQDAVIGGMAQRKGLSEEQIAEAKRATRSNTQTDVVSRFLARGEYKAGQAYFDEVREQISADQATQLEASFTAERRRQETEAKAQNALLQQDLQIQMADTRAAAVSGLPVTLPDRGTLRQAFGPVRGDQYYSQLQGYQKLSNETAGLNQKSNTELLELAKSFVPTEQRGAAEAVQISGLLNQQVTRVLEARKADPVGYLSNTSPTVAAAIEQIETNEPGSGQAYFNAVEAEKERLGIASTFVFPKGLIPGSTEYQQVAVLATNKYRELPPQAAAFAVNALKSNDPQAVTQAAKLLDAASNIAPAAYTNVPETLRAKAAMVARMVNSGAEPERAVQTAVDALRVTPEIRAQRAAQYREYSKSSPAKLDALIDDAYDAGFSGVFSSQPAAAVQLQGDFQAQAGAYFQQTGDIELSRDLAFQDLRRVYGPTEVNGRKQVVAFPVERFSLSPKDVRTEISGVLAQFPQSDGSTADDITLVADSDTLRLVSDGLSGKKVEPSYRLVTKTGDLVRDKDGLPLRYSVPSQEERLTKYNEELRKQDLENELTVRQAKFDRETRRRLEQYRATEGLR